MDAAAVNLGLDRNLPFGSLLSVISSTVIIVLLWSTANRYVSKNGAFSGADTVLEAHNFVLATVSLVLAAYVLDIGHNVLDLKTGVQVNPYVLGYCYHVLKVYEGLDIILSVLAGEKSISKYYAFTHLFLPYWSFYRIIDRPTGSTDWRLHVITDCTARFLSRAVPWLIEDVKSEEAILNMVEEGRWYTDLAIAAFWALFTFQNRREDEQALQIFGKPYENEITARILSVGLLLYAGHLKRQEDAERLRVLQAAKPAIYGQSPATNAAQSTPHVSTRQISRKKR